MVLYIYALISLLILLFSEYHKSKQCIRGFWLSCTAGLQAISLYEPTSQFFLLVLCMFHNKSLLVTITLSYAHDVNLVSELLFYKDFEQCWIEPLHH